MLRKQGMMYTSQVKLWFSKHKELVLVISSYCSVSFLFQYKIKAALAHTHIFNMVIK